MNLLLQAILCVALGLLPAAAQAQRQMEKLGRGVVAVRASSTKVYVSWRMLGTDPPDVAFNVYRSANGAAAVKLNSTPITATTDYTDTSANLANTNAYHVRPMINGVESPASAAWTLAANASVRQYIPVPLQAVAGGTEGPYDVKFAWVGDLDGDGEYDLVVDRLSTISGTAEQYLQAYKRDGTLLWQMNMGPNSTNQYVYEPSSSAISIGDTDNVTVFDLDGDGKAEVIVRTANGVTVRSAAGTQVASITAPGNSTQFISIFNGETGAELARATIPNPWAQYGTLTNKAAIAYLDGVRPSVLLYGYNRDETGVGKKFYRVFTTWDYRNGVLSQRWTWAQDQSSAATPGAEGHQIRIADVDHDGKDEICEIGHVLDDNGKQLWVNNLTHGDRFHVTDIDPDRPGMETYAIGQNNPTLLAARYYDADTGVTIQDWFATGIVDTGRGIALDMDPTYFGLEMYCTQPGIFDARGNQIYQNTIWPPEGLWWDGDLSREFIDGAGSGAYSPVVNKFNPSTGTAQRLYTIYSEGVRQQYGGRPAFWGDILGDWREEIVLVASDYSELRIYTTKIPAATRLYTLMHNAAYRVQATTKGYVQASYTDYYLGTDMEPPPPPPVSDAKLIWKGNGVTNTWDAVTANWVTNWFWSPLQPPAMFAPGDTVLFDLSGSNAPSINLSGTLAPGAVTVHSPKNHVFAGSGSLSGVMSLTKAGGGSLTLEGRHTFTGATLVAEGALIVKGNLSASPVTVRGGVWFDGALAGTGTVGGGATIRRAAGLSPGDTTGAVGTLTIGNQLTETGGVTNRFDLSNSPSGSNDRVQVNGNVTLTGTNTILVNATNGPLQTGVYPLITLTGTLTGSTANLRLAGLTGVSATLTAGNGSINLVVFSGPRTITWRGTGAQWDTTSSNWLFLGSPAQYIAGDAVTFDATGAAAPNVTLNGALQPAVVTVNATSAYSFGGTGSIGGNAQLVKAGSGLLTINGANSYTSGTRLQGGTIALANDTANETGLGSGVLTLEGGTLQMFESATTYNSVYWNIDVSAGTSGIIRADSRIDLRGRLTGAGTVNLYVPWIRTTLFGDWSEFSGRINVTTATAGDFRMENRFGYPNAKINLGPNVTGYAVLNEERTYLIGELTGGSTARLQGITPYSGTTPGNIVATYEVGGLHTDFGFGGAIANGSGSSRTGITKAGAGTWTLSGNCTYTGPTQVLAGTLRFAGSASGTSSLSVSAGATLALTQGATLQVGGNVVNNGILRFTGGSMISATGPITNNGVADIMTGGSLPANFVNNGVVIDASSIRPMEAALSGTEFTVTIQSFAGHNYQLQRRDQLTTGSWTNVGSAKPGNGEVLMLSDPAAASGTSGFYRVFLEP